MNLTFETFTAKDYNLVLPYFNLRPTYTCESHFLYHVIWKDFYNSQFCIDDDSVFWLIHPGENVAALPPTTNKNNLKKAFINLQAYFTSTLNKKLNLYLLDQDALEILDLDQTKYEIIEDRSSFDYIYEGNILRELTGRKYSKKRNHINAFLRDNEGNFEYKALTKEDKEEILSFTHKWVQEKNSDDPYNRVENEEIGINNVLEAYPTGNANMAGIYVDGNLESFTAGTYDPILKVAAIHIEKANPEIRGLYPYINQQFLINEFPDAKYINREDDMGVPSLRKAKESYYPLGLAKKYTIKER